MTDEAEVKINSSLKIYKWRNKPITELSIEDLKVAETTLSNMFTTYDNNKNSPEYKEKYKGREIPPINPFFLELFKAIGIEIDSRSGIIK